MRVKQVNNVLFATSLLFPICIGSPLTRTTNVAVGLLFKSSAVDTITRGNTFRNSYTSTFNSYQLSGRSFNNSLCEMHEE